MIAKGMVTAGALMALVPTVLAFDADTLAFYAFKEGASGESLVGKSVLNNARQGSNSGTPSGTCTFADDAPAKYVFDTSYYGAELLCTDPQSVHFAKGNIDFTDLATDISLNDDYTIEFFYKIEKDELDKNRQWKPVLSYDIRTHGDAAAGSYDGNEHPMNVLLYENDATKMTFYTYCGDMNDFAVYPQPVTPTNFSDGLWHHFALVYSKSTHKLEQYLDYGKKNAAGQQIAPWHQVMRKKRDTYNAAYVANEVQTGSVPVSLGGTGFTGKIACFRVTKSARDPEQFLRASNEPSLYTRTVFHYGLEGANGEAAEYITNRVQTGNALTPGQYWSTVLNPQDTKATAFVGTAAISPVFTNSIPNARKTRILEGETDLGENVGSLYFSAAVGTQDGAGLVLGGTQYEPLDEGSFTVEMFVKFDQDVWLAKNGSNSNMRVTLIGQHNAAYTYDWALFYEYQKTYKYFQVWSAFSGDGASGARGGARLMSDGAWHHVAVVYDEDNLKQTIYFDYKEVGTSTFALPFRPRVPRENRALYIGCQLQDCFEGLIDEVRIVRGVLTSDQFLRCGRVKQGMMLILR